ncbi:hypothetical protein [uncultured Mediterranean phage]|nr:hypothetical protein [uncultured Mediterranean phage]
MRIKAGYSAPISRALLWLPEPIRRLVEHTDWLTGTDAIYAGMGYGADEALTQDGRSYRTVNHCAYEWHQMGLPKSLRRTTIVLPGPTSELHTVSVTHELGHVLDERLGFDYDFPPVTAYAETNRQEAFAEAFVTWHWGRSVYVGEDLGPEAIPEAVALFDSLAKYGVPA